MTRLLRICFLMGLSLVMHRSAFGQRLRDIPEQVDLIYELMPELPLEDNYVSINGEVMSGSNWLKRLLLYHIQTQGRLPDSRFDWRMTFADFLGANEPIYANQYPGAASFATNPLNRDRELFRALTRQERNRLLEALEAVYGNTSVINPLEKLAAVNGSSTSLTIQESQQETEAATEDRAVTIDVAEPGAADLLLPPSE